MSTEVKRDWLAEVEALLNWPDEPVYVDGIRKAKPIPDIEHLRAAVEHARKLEAQIEQLQARRGGECDFDETVTRTGSLRGK